MQSEGVAILPVRVNCRWTRIRIHILDTNDVYVPILLGVDTLTALGVIMDFGRRRMIMNMTNDSGHENYVPIQHSITSSGHYAIDLTKDILSVDRSTSALEAQWVKRGGAEVASAASTE